MELYSTEFRQFYRKQKGLFEAESTFLDTIVGIQNPSQFLPLFYILPGELLSIIGCSRVPRHPARVISNPQWHAAIHKDEFMWRLMSGVAWLIWPALCTKGNIKEYSLDDSLVRLACCTHIWLQALEDSMHTNLDSLLQLPLEHKIPVPTFEESHSLFLSIGNFGISAFGYQDMVEHIASHRCHEDYHTLKSGIGRDFDRKWNRSRTKVGTSLSLTWANPGYDAHLDFHADLSIFKDSLPAIERCIFEMWLDTYTLQEIAERVGLKTHSAVKKRIDKIGKKYKAYMRIS